MAKEIRRRQVNEELLMTDTERLARIRVKMKNTETDAKKQPDLSLRAKAIILYINTTNAIMRRIMAIMTSQTEKAIRKRLPDDTLWGKILFGVLDAVSLPQMHEIWKAVEKELPNGSLKEKLKLYWQKVDGVRTLASVVVSVITLYFLTT